MAKNTKYIGENEENIKAAKSSPTSMDVLYLIMLHNDGNVNKKFEPSILNRSQEN